jgi:hypothetical protein
MINERIDTIRLANGEAVQMRFDLSDADLFAIARSVGTVVAERYRGVALDADDVLAMRELMALQEVALARAEDGHAGGTLIVSVRRLGLLVEALGDWLTRRLELGFWRADEAQDHPLVEQLVEDLRGLHVRGLQAALATGTPELALH